LRRVHRAVLGQMIHDQIQKLDLPDTQGLVDQERGEPNMRADRFVSEGLLRAQLLNRDAILMRTKIHLRVHAALREITAESETPPL
jgi:hypothetical protein